MSASSCEAQSPPSGPFGTLTQLSDASGTPSESASSMACTVGAKVPNAITVRHTSTLLDTARAFADRRRPWARQPIKPARRRRPKEPSAGTPTAAVTLIGDSRVTRPLMSSAPPGPPTTAKIFPSRPRSSAIWPEPAPMTVKLSVATSSSEGVAWVPGPKVSSITKSTLIWSGAVGQSNGRGGTFTLDGAM